MNQSVLDKTIASLNFPPLTRNILCKLTISQEEKKTAAFKKLSQKISVKNVIQNWESGNYETPYQRNQHLSASTKKRFFSKLVEEGLTRWEWIELPQETIEGKKFSKEEWLEKDIRLLGTIPSNRKPFLVKDLLKIEPLSFTSIGIVRIANTRARLKEIGFTKEDGLFLSSYISGYRTLWGMSLNKAREKIEEIEMKKIL